MIIEGVIDAGSIVAPFFSDWTYDSADPLAVTVSFGDHGPIWTFSLDLLWDAFTDPSGSLHGSGDVKVEVEGESAFLYLSNGIESAVLKFPSLEIQDFLDQTSYTDPDEVIARELDDFLNAL